MNDNIVKTIKLPRGFTGVILYDPYPRPYDGDTLCQIAYLSRSHYTLGTEAVSEQRMDEIAEGIKSGELIGLPIYAYVHGGATIRTGPFNCPWDSGMSGFAYVDREAAMAEFKDEAAVLRCIESEVKTFDAYLKGEVYGWELRDPEDESVDACWGYYGDDELDYIEQEIHESAACHIQDLEEQEAKAEAKRLREYDEVAYWAARDVTTTGSHYGIY